MSGSVTSDLNAARFIERLRAMQSAAELAKILRYFKSGPGDPGAGDLFIGVRMGSVFALAKEFSLMSLAEIEKLLESEIHEARAGALSLMGKQYALKTCTEDRRKELYELYLRRHDRVNNWDLVDLGALYVVGPYLLDKPRKMLYKLARSKDIWERRTAIVSTGPFIRKGQVDDTFAIAALLLGDAEDLVHKATGWMLRAAGDVDRLRLLAFLDEHAGSMPRVPLRYSIEKLGKDEKAKYMGAKG